MNVDKETSYYVFDTSSKFINQRSCDCVIRSISLATGKSWLEVFDGLCVIAKKMFRVPNEKAVYERYLKEIGWVKMPAPRYDDNHRYLAKDFVKILKQTAVVRVGGHHVSCFLNDKIHDIWNCGDGSVGNYWIKNSSNLK